MKMKKKLITIIILGVLIWSCNKNDINTLNDGLMAYYPFNGNAQDRSGNSHNGIIYGAILTEDRFHNPEHAFLFTGNNSYIDLDYNFDYPLRTINLWFYANTIDQIERHLYISDNPQLLFGFTQIKIREIDGEKAIRSSAGIPGGIAEAKYEVSEKRWYMITLVVDENSTKHYLNGDLIGEFPNDIISSYNGSESALLGTSRVYDRFFNGKIDDVRIYSRALSESEIHLLNKSR
jgi:hypothetical protein